MERSRTWVGGGAGTERLNPKLLKKVSGRETEEAAMGHFQAEVYEEGEVRDLNVVEGNRVI